MILPLGSGPEFDRIRAIVGVLGDAAGPIGDDTAYLPEHTGTVVVSTDTSMEGTHFKLAWLSLEEIGWRAAAAALSDLAAAGAEPLGILAAISVPSEGAPEKVIALMKGVGDCAQSVETKVLGGDLTTAPVWSATVTVLGSAARPLSRRGARPGDALWVTGSLGGSRAALIPWLSGTEPDPAARAAFASPVPRITAARWLKSQGATAMMDTTDGLAGDLNHLAAASEVAIEVELSRLPLHPSVRSVALEAGVDPGHFAALGGEDYELLVTLPGNWSPPEGLIGGGVTLTRIGEVGSGSGVRLRQRGRPVVLQGYSHQV